MKTLIIMFIDFNENNIIEQNEIINIIIYIGRSTNSILFNNQLNGGTYVFARNYQVEKIKLNRRLLY